MLSQTEENYLKCILKLQLGSETVLTNQIAAEMRNTAGTVTDMVKRLAEKKLIHYERYKGVTLTSEGQTLATQLVRKHRLWEVFLHEKLGFEWHEVHDIAEELEHVSSTAFVDRLDKYLGFPRYDPHGDPIPDAHGRIEERRQIPLADVKKGQSGVVIGVLEHSTSFLHYLQETGLTIGKRIKVLQIISYDQSVHLLLEDETTLQVSEKVSKYLLIQVKD